ASVQVTSGEVTAEELAEEGVTVKVTGLEKGDKVSAKSGLTGPATTAQGSTATMKLRSANEVTQESVSFAVQVQREGTAPATETSVVPLAEDPEAPEVDPKVSLSTTEISQSRFDENGITVTGEGFTPNGKVTVVGGTATSPFATQEVTADAEGKISATTLKFEGDEPLPAGDYSVWGVDQEAETNSPAQDFTITEDDAVEPIDASLKVNPKEITAEDLANRETGVTVTVSGVKKGDKITDSLTGRTETAEADGDYELNLWYDGNPDNLEVGKVPFTVNIDREGTESETL